MKFTESDWVKLVAWLTMATWVGISTLLMKYTRKEEVVTTLCDWVQKVLNITNSFQVLWMSQYYLGILILADLTELIVNAAHEAVEDLPECPENVYFNYTGLQLCTTHKCLMMNGSYACPWRIAFHVFFLPVGLAIKGLGEGDWAEDNLDFGITESINEVSEFLKKHSKPLGLVLFYLVFFISVDVGIWMDGHASCWALLSAIGMIEFLAVYYLVYLFP